MSSRTHTVDTRTPAVRSEDFFAALADMDEYLAADLVNRALDTGLSPQHVLLRIIAPAQAKVGEEWAAGRFTVAREHAATAISDRAIAVHSRHRAAAGAPGTRTPGTGAPGTGTAVTGAPGTGTAGTRTAGTCGRVTVACVDGEWHALPARLVAETLKLSGWQVDFLGAHVPAPHLIAHLHATGPDAVALSCSLATRLPVAHATITACQAAGIPVLVGGAAFGPDGRYARLLGADAWAPDAVGAAARLKEQGAMTLAHPEPGDPFTALPHLADQEYTLLSRSRRQIVSQAMNGLQERLPAMSGYTARQREHTHEDLGHIADFLTAAVYLDQAQVLTDFLGWTSDILAARNVPPQALGVTLDVFAGHLRDFPRALAIIDTSRSAITTVSTPPRSRITEDNA